MRLLLHACCGPCSLEPVRLLQERGVNPDIYYSNSNIAPADEYGLRLETIRSWAETEGLKLIEGDYEPEEWRRAVSAPTSDPCASRAERCRACYRQRFQASAAFAASAGYTALGTTLSVSPYQYTSIIREELERACADFGLECAFEDYSPQYGEATRRSREAGMYRQKYCGCAYSKAEAEQERQERLAERERRRKERESVLEEERKQAAARKAERAAYDAKRARQREILKSLRSGGQERNRKEPGI